MENLEKKIDELSQHILALQLICGDKEKNRKTQLKEKRPQTEKQKQHNARFKAAYDKWAPEFKSKNPSLRSTDILKMVNEKMKDQK